jgi:hypothetical protein
MEYRWVSYRAAAAHLPAAERLGVSKVARSTRGFMAEYREAKSAAAMRKRPVPGYPGQTWGQRRTAFIERHLAQFKKNPTERRRLALLMWAYRP